jgi:integrase
MSFRYECTLPGIGPIRKTTGLSDPADITEFKGLMVSLARSRPKLAEMFRDGALSATELLVANREDGGLSRLEPDPRVLVALWGEQGAFAEAWRRHPKREGATVRRYRVSATKLERLGLLPVLPEFEARYPGGLAPQTVRDLERLDWDAIAASWQGSPSDWMAFYRMLSHFLTRHFGGRRVGKAHPWRARVLDLLPRKAERRRVPAISPAVFARLVARTPDYAQPCYHALLITGFRVRSEYLALGREHLRPQVFEVEVPGTKTAGSAAVVPVDPACWPMLERAVPSPLAYGQIRKHWMRACLEEGLATKAPDVAHPGRLRYQGPTLHDIRHLTGQFMTNAGVPESMVQVYLRHTDAATTRRYTVQALRTEAAAAMARVIGAAS